MSLEVRIGGGPLLARVAAQIRAEGRKDLSREMGQALARAAAPVERSIRAEAAKAMPSSGGYKALLSQSLRFKTARRAAGQSASYRLITYADGTRERRDVGALERGNLRHPVYGRSRKLTRGRRAGTVRANPWSVTRIRPGFHERGTENAGDEAEAQLEDVLADFAQRLIK